MASSTPRISRAGLARAPLGQHLADEFRHAGIDARRECRWPESSTSVTCSSSANWSGENTGPASALATDWRAKRVSAAAPPTRKTAPSSKRATIEFSAVCPSPTRRLLRPGVSAKLHRTGTANVCSGSRNPGPWKRDYRVRQAIAAGREAQLSDGRAHRHRRRLHVGDRRVGGLLERHRFPGRGVGDQPAQQLVVELVAGLVAAELADQAVPE